MEVDENRTYFVLDTTMKEVVILALLLGSCVVGMTTAKKQNGKAKGITICFRYLVFISSVVKKLC